MPIRRAAIEDMTSIHSLLTESALTSDGVSDHLSDFLVAETEGRIQAVAGLEVYGLCALLRSVAVRSTGRRRGQGQAMVVEILRHAAARGVRDLYLLTTTAPGFFARLGFAVVERSEAPDSIRATREFAELCPDSAIFMRRSIAEKEPPCP